MSSGRTMADRRLATWVGVLVALSAGCSSSVTIINRPVETEQHEWRATVQRLGVGPNRFRADGTDHESGPGMRFVHVSALVRNLSSEPRNWDWNRCSLDHPTADRTPTVVLEHDLEGKAVPSEQEIEPKGQTERWLVFAYPADDKLPSRLTCSRVVVPLDPTK